MSSSLQTISQRLERSTEMAATWTGVFIGPLLIVALLRWLFDLVERLHWSLELGLTGGFLALLWLLIRWLKTLPSPELTNHESLAGAVGVFLCSVLFAVTLFSQLSLMLWRWQPDSYTGASSYLPGNFADFYFWHLFESIPGLKLMSTYEVPLPMTPKGRAAATLLLVFRGAVVVGLLGILRKWLKQRAPTNVPNAPA